MALKTEVVKVTPAIAHRWLATNHDNRPIRDHLVHSFAEDMLNDDWDDNGETIKFDEKNELVDGQHRLLAIIESNRTITMLVVRGVKRKAQNTIDTGAKKTFANILSMRKEKNAPILAAIVRKVYLWKDGVQQSKKSIATTPMLERTLEEYPWLRDVAREASAIAANTNLMASVVGYCWFMFFQISPEDCKFFFERLTDGQDLSKGNPILSLKNKLERLSRNDHERMSDVWTTAVTIKAWNKYRAGESWEIVDFRPGGANPEKMPVPR